MLVTKLSSLKPSLKSGTSKGNRPDSPPSSVRGGLPSALSSLLADNVSYSTPARGHLALIFLAELAFEVASDFLPHLPVIMHQVITRYDRRQKRVP